MATEKMNVDERLSYLRIMRERYAAADKTGRTALLTEMEATTHLHRKYLIARMHCYDLRRRVRDQERSRTYGPDVELAVGLVADALDWIGADRIQPYLPATAQNLADNDHLTLNAFLLAQLETISVSTLRRMIQRIGRPEDALPHIRRGRRPDSVMQALVPMGIIPWQEPEPGHFELDLVYHIAYGVEGQCVCSVHLIDVLTGWSERFAILGRTFDQVWQAIQAFKQRCPIPVIEIHTDNGPEFMNYAFITQFGAEAVHIRLTRGRPGYKNDNRFVEQKNSSLVRAYLGRLSLTTPEQRDLLNRIYADMWCYYNLFQPVVRQTCRRVTQGPDGLCRIVRTQDLAATPLDRLLSAKPPLAREKAEQLLALRAETDLLGLKRRIHHQLGDLARLAEPTERRETITFG